MARAGPSTQKAHMSKQQPEALRLADGLATVAKYSDCEHWDTHTLEQAAAELHRLHALNAELLGALKLNYAELSSQWTPYIRANEKEVAAMKAARAAIAKAEGREA